ncbi:hypothetical protein FHG87_010985 [Trinorchestia longiramus]|nr:hypothetical protein FHG87_010985 [Trinorchestia longiramus]
MLRTRILFILIITGTTVLDTATQAKVSPTTGIFGWPLERISSSTGCDGTVTNTVQVPLFIVRTKTMWYDYPEALTNQPTRTVYLQPASTVSLTRTLYNVKTSYVTMPPMYSTTTYTETIYQIVPCTKIQRISTTLVPQFTFATVTATPLLPQRLASMVTSPEVSSRVVLVTKTQIMECGGQETSLVTQTVTRTNMKFITRTFTDVYDGSSSTTGSAPPDTTSVLPQGLPMAYLRF